MTAMSAAAPGFASLAELQENHAALVKEVGKEILVPANLERIAQFVRKGVATGTVLGAPTDRAAAQSLISFWTARLASAARDLGKENSPAQVPEFDDTLLAEFNSDALVAAVITPADEWLDRQSPTDQTLARRLVLRLVTLREDGSFEVVSSASGVCEDLAPQNRAKKVLAELVRLGVVRSTRNPSGHEEFALGSAELLKRWRRLKDWMDERKRFRAKATQWAQRRAEKEADPPKRLFMRRAGEAFGVASLKVSDWIEARWRALLVSLRIRGATEKFLSEEEYEEAETYRDKNAVELRLVYKKRQHDKEEQERRQARAVAFAAAAVVFATLLVLAILGWVVALDARKQEAEAKKLAKLHLADLYCEKGAQSEADDRDASGAFLWYVAAWSEFDASADVLESGHRERLRASNLLRLATAREGLPFLSGMAYHKQLLASARTSDGRFLLTVGAAEDRQTTPPVVRFWRWTDRRGHAEWEPSPLPWGQTPPGQAFDQSAAYVSPNGRFAVVSRSPRDAASAVYVWKIPEAGPGEYIGELRGCDGKVTAAGFSPDSQLFAVVSQLEDKGKVSLWRSDAWDAPIELAVPDGIGQLGQLAFCPPPSSKRLAVAVAPVLPTSRNDRLICLEWSLNECRAEAPLRRYTWLQQFPLGSLQGETQTFVTYKPDGTVLLVSQSLQNSRLAYVWLFNSKKDPTTERKDPTTESPTTSFQLLPLAGPVLHAAFSPGDDRLVISSADGNAVLWSSQSTGQSETHYYQMTNTFKHTAQIFKADFSPDGHYIVTASRDHRALVWDADSGKLAHPSFHHSGSVTDAGFTDDGRSLVTSSEDTICRWDLTRGESRPLPLGTMQGVGTASADPEGNLLVTAGERLTRREQLGSAGWARVWDAVTGDPRSPELQHPAPVLHAAISGSGLGLVSTVTSDGEVRLWEASSGRRLWSEKPKEGMAVYTAFGCAEGGVHLLALIRSNPRSLSSDSYLRIYPLNSKGEQTDGVQTFKYAAPFTAAAFSPKCKHVIAYTGDGADNRGVAVVWEVQSGMRKVLKRSGKKGSAHDEAITHAAFTSDGDYLVTTGRDDKAFVWSLRDGSCWELLTKKDEEIGHTADIVFASFDRAGTRVVTAGADGRAIVWERTPDQQQFGLVQKLKNNRALTHAVFSTDERYVLTADTDGTTRLWDVKDSRPITTKYHPGQIILRLVFREDEDGHARVSLIGNQARRGPAYYNRPGQRPGFSVANPSAWPVVTEWRLTSAAPPGDDDQHLAQWSASRQLIDNGVRTELTYKPQDAMFKLWKETSARPNLTGPSSSDEVAKWHEREAALCELDGWWSPAIEHWTHALENTSVKRRPILLARRARASSELPDWEHAEQDLTAALSEIPRDSELLQARANARIQRSHLEKDQNKLKDAISDYQQALQANQDNGLAHAQLAAALVESRQFKEAVAQFDEAVQLDEKNPDLLVNRAAALTKSGDRRFDRAYADFLTAGRLFKDRRLFDDADKAYSGAVGLFKDGVESSQQLQAKVHAELAEVQESRASVTFNDEQKRESYYQAACKHFLDATSLDDTVWTYWSGLARCHEHLGEWKEARQAFEKALKLNPGDPTLTVSWAESLVQLKDWDEAAKAYLAIIKHEPKELLSQQSILWLRLAVVQLAAGKIDDYQATRDGMFEAFKTPLVNDANRVAWAAAFAKDTPEGVERAIKLAVKAVSVSPQNFNYLNTYGAVLYRGNKREDAIKKLEEATKQRALAHLPSDQLAYGNALDKLFIAMAQYTPEQPEQARQTLKLAVQTIDRVKPAQQFETPEQSLARVWQRLEFEVLRREAESLINR